VISISLCFFSPMNRTGQLSVKCPVGARKPPAKPQFSRRGKVAILDKKTNGLYCQGGACHLVQLTGYRPARTAMDGIVNDDVPDHLDRIKIYPIQIKSEEDLVRDTARAANLSMKLGCQLEAENQMPTKEEAYVHLGHSASLLKAILNYVTL